MIEEEEAARIQAAAEELGQLVSETGRAARIFGATPPVRKVMHTALNEDDGVDNASAGFGMFRHVVLRPQAGQIEPAGEEE